MNLRSHNHSHVRVATVILIAVTGLVVLFSAAHPHASAAGAAQRFVPSVDSIPLPPADSETTAASYESGEGANPFVLPVTVTVVPPPDLVPVILCATWENVDTGIYHITWAIANQGPGTAEPSTALLTINGVVHTEGIPELGPGESHTFVLESVTLSESGSDVLVLTADVNEEVRWDTRDNNTTELTVTTPEEETLNLSLSPGWNMVSVPLLLENTSPDAVFPAAEGVVAVYEWNPDGTCYVPPDSIDPTRAYWVAVTKPTTLPLTGLALTSYVVDLTPGWHMLGSVWLGDEGGAVSRFAGAPPLALRLPAYELASSGAGYLSTAGVETGAGFWLSVDGSCTVQVS